MVSTLNRFRSALAVFILMRMSSTTGFQLASRRSTITMVSSSQPTDNFQSVLADVVNVITTTGPRQGLTRSIQIATAVRSVTQRFLTDQKSFQDDNGRLSIPKTIKSLFEELGATYIKLGQFIASSPTLFPAEFVLEFQSCLDNSPKIPYSSIRKIIQDDLGKPLSAVYSYVDPTPLASASVAQVHRAKLCDGTEVVIKVRKPGVDANLKVDLGFLYVSSRLIEFVNPSLSRVSFSTIVGDLRESMLDELDFTREAQNLIQFREFLEKFSITGATAPKPYLDASSKQVLTMEYLKGVPLVNLEGVKKFSPDTADTLFVAIATWGKSVAELDRFHADLHGGNLLVLEDGRIGFLDFGIVGRITKPILNAMGALLQATVNSDYDGVAAALVSIGATSKTIDEAKLGRELKEVIAKITAMVPDPSASLNAPAGGNMNIGDRESTKLVLEVVEVAENNGLKLPREFGLLLKQALYFDRYQKLLAPGSDPLRDPRLKEYLKSEMGEYQGQGTSDYSVPPIVEEASNKVSEMIGSTGDVIFDTEILQ